MTAVVRLRIVPNVPLICIDDSQGTDSGERHSNEDQREPEDTEDKIQEPVKDGDQEFQCSRASGFGGTFQR